MRSNGYLCHAGQHADDGEKCDVQDDHVERGRRANSEEVSCERPVEPAEPEVHPHPGNEVALEHQDDDDDGDGLRDDGAPGRTRHTKRGETHPTQNEAVVEEDVE